MNKKAKLFGKVTLLLLVMMISLSSCDFEYDIAEAYSVEDNTPPVAAFTVTQSTESDEDAWKTVFFGNASSSATVYSWDFGDGTSDADATEVEPVHSYVPSLDDIDKEVLYYTVTLQAMDDLGVISTYTEEIELIKPIVPLLLDPGVINGDFDAKTDFWRFSSFPGGTTTPFNTSSDGSPLLYDGTESGNSKTPGTKWTSSTSAGASVSGNSRYGYQPLTLSPNGDYIVEFAYAIKTDNEDIAGGDRAIIEILDGQFSDGNDAVAASNSGGTLAQILGTAANGKGNFKVETAAFTANASGEVSVMIYAATKDELYIDNVKVYPAN